MGRNVLNECVPEAKGTTEVVIIEDITETEGVVHWGRGLHGAWRERAARAPSTFKSLHHSQHIKTQCLARCVQTRFVMASVSSVCCCKENL